MHPSDPWVESLVDEKLPPGDGPIRIEPFSAGHLQLRAKEERGVRVDQQQRVMIRGVRWGNGDAIRSAWLYFWRRERCCCLVVAAVERLQFFQLHALDVAPDAALGKRESHPGLKVLNHTRLHLGMFRQVEVGSIREGIHQL